MPPPKTRVLTQALTVAALAAALGACATAPPTTVRIAADPLAEGTPDGSLGWFAQVWRRALHADLLQHGFFVTGLDGADVAEPDVASEPPTVRLSGTLTRHDAAQVKLVLRATRVDSGEVFWDFDWQGRPDALLIAEDTAFRSLADVLARPIARRSARPWLALGAGPRYGALLAGEGPEARVRPDSGDDPVSVAEYACPGFTAVLEAGPSALVMTDYGRCLAAAGRVDNGVMAEAIARLEGAVALDPDLILARLALAEALFWQQGAADAIPHLEHAIALNPHVRAVRELLLRALSADAEVVRKEAKKRLVELVGADEAASDERDAQADLAEAARLRRAVEVARGASTKQPVEDWLERLATLADHRDERAAAQGYRRAALVRHESVAAVSLDAVARLVEGLVRDAPAAAAGERLPRAAVGWDAAETSSWLDAHPDGLLATDVGGFRLLHQAAERGAVDSVATLLARGAVVDAMDALGQTALHRAAWRGQAPIVKQLLKHGAMIGARDRHGYTALHRAAWAGHVGVVHLLARGGARDAARSTLLETPLHLAAGAGHRKAVEALLGLGADVAARDSRLRSAAWLAARRGNVDALNAIARRPDAATQDALLEDAQRLIVLDDRAVLGRILAAQGGLARLDHLLEYAASEGSAETVRDLLARGAAPDGDGDGARPLENALSAGRGDSALVLIDAGASLARRPAAERGPLHLVVALNRVDLVQRMLEGGVDLDERDIKGVHVLSIAARERSAPFDAEGRVAILKLLAARVGAAAAAGSRSPVLDQALLDAADTDYYDGIDVLLAAGASLAARDGDGRTAFLAAAYRGRTRTVQHLAAAGADAAARSVGGDTALHLALYGSLGRGSANEGLLEALAAAGVPIDAADARGVPPLRLALRLGLNGEALLLLEAGAEPDAWVAAALGDTQRLRAIVRADASGLSRADEEGWTPAHWAAAYGTADTVRVLAGLKAALDVTGPVGAPLHVAVRRGAIDIVKALLGANADPDVAFGAMVTATPFDFIRALTNAPGDRPLHTAVRMGSADAVELLLRAGADIDAPNALGETPLMVAAWSGRGEIAKTLAEKGANPSLETEDGYSLVKPPSDYLNNPLGRLDGPGAGMAKEGGGAGRSSAKDKIGMRVSRRSLDYDVMPVRQHARPLLDVGAISLDATIAAAATQRADYAAAERLWGDLLAMVVKNAATDDSRVPKLRHNLGRVQMFRGDLVAARENLEAALAALAALRAAEDADRDTRDMSVCREHLALLDLLEGDVAGAIDTLSALVTDRLARWPTGSLTARAADHLAGALTVIGDYHAAEARYLAALDILVDRYGETAPATLATQNNLGALYETIGDVTAADAIYTAQLRALLEAVDIEEFVEPAHLAVALANSAGTTLRAGAAEAARETLRRALKTLQDGYGDAHELRPGVLLAIARVDRAIGEVAAARSSAAAAKDAAATVLGPEHPFIAHALSLQAQLDLDAGRYAAAEATLVDALVLADEGDDTAARWAVRQVYSALLIATGRPRAAVFVLKQAVNALQAARAGLQGADGRLKAAFVADKGPVYRQLAALLVDDGRIAEAQSILAMLKSDEYYDFVRRDRNRAAGAATAALTEREAGVSEDYRGISSRLASLGRERAELRAKKRSGGLSDPDKARLKVIRKQLKVARQQFSAYLQRLNTTLAADPGRREARDLDAVRGLQDTLATLGPGAVALHYVLGPKALHILVTAPEVQIARTSAVGRTVIDRQVLAFREALDTPRSDALAPAKTLWRTLMTPIIKDLEDLKAKTLVVSLDGNLRYVPLAALHDGKRWLIERFDVVLLAEAAKDKLTRSPLASPTVAGLGVSKAHGDFAALPAVPAELEAIINRGAGDNDGVAPGVIHLDAAFDADTLMDTLDGAYSMVHLASHFEFRPSTNKDSFLLLGTGESLSLYDLEYDDYSFKGVDLLTLSACNTAMGMGDAGGREVEGFGALALKLGARSVIATLWPVSDESTGAFMQHLYRLLKDGDAAGKAAAMAMAQRALMRGEIDRGGGAAGGTRGRPGFGPKKPPATHPDAAAPRFAHPYYWAPFILLGNWL